MNCECCKTDFDAQNIEPEIGGSTDDSFEVNFACPHCSQGYYTYVNLADCSLDPVKRGNKEGGAK